ncbi:MAG: Iron(3+)-hydroxamate-binding protein FhuD [Pseudomonas citronellolis]|nr:MAG: Iron(3+)-hydroxamate-binding protein FhuD [Pseudomonas citronellolis]
MTLSRRSLIQHLGLLAAGAALPPLGWAEPALERVVAINWAAAESLLTLGVVPIAISDGSYYDRRMPTGDLPPSVQDIGPYWEPNLELIQALRPQLILADPLPPPIARSLNRLAPTEIVDIFPTRDNVWAGCTRFLQRLAARVNRADAAQAWIDNAEQRLDRCRARLATSQQPPICVAVLNQDGRHATVYGRNSLPQAMLERLGLRNAWQGASSPMGNVLAGIDRLADDPTAHLLYIEIPTTSARLQSLRQPNELWNHLPAVRQGHAQALGKFFPNGGAASCLYLAERITDYLDPQGATAHG